MGRGGKEWLRGKDDEVMPELFERMAEGHLVIDVCKEKGWPVSTISLWANSPKWLAQYVEAQHAQGSYWGEEVLQMARTALEAKDMVKLRAIEIMTKSLQWNASKHNWRLYGDKVDVTTRGMPVNGVIALPPEELLPQVVDPPKLTQGATHGVEQVLDRQHSDVE